MLKYFSQLERQRRGFSPLNLLKGSLGKRPGLGLCWWKLGEGDWNMGWWIGGFGGMVIGGGGGGGGGRYGRGGVWRGMVEGMGGNCNEGTADDMLWKGKDGAGGGSGSLHMAGTLVQVMADPNPTSR